MVFCSIFPSLFLNKRFKLSRCLKEQNQIQAYLRVNSNAMAYKNLKEGSVPWARCISQSAFASEFQLQLTNKEQSASSDYLCTLVKSTNSPITPPPNPTQPNPPNYLVKWIAMDIFYSPPCHPNPIRKTGNINGYLISTQVLCYFLTPKLIILRWPRSY